MTAGPARQPRMPPFSLPADLPGNRRREKFRAGTARRKGSCGHEPPASARDRRRRRPGQDFQRLAGKSGSSVLPVLTLIMRAAPRHHLPLES